jgi:hypothetical protein
MKKTIFPLFSLRQFHEIFILRSSLIGSSTKTQFSSVYEVLGLPVCFSVIIQYRLAVFKFGRLHSLTCEESLYKFSSLQGTDHSTHLRLGIIFIVPAILSACG